MQCTCKDEENNYLIFLDLTKIRDTTNKLKSKWYTKPTSSGRYLNYNSNHPQNQKISVMIGLTDRVISLTSPEYRKETLKTVQDILLNNHSNFIIQIMTVMKLKICHKFLNPTCQNITVIKRRTS